MEEDLETLEDLKNIFIHLKTYGWINDIKRDVVADKVIQAIENLIARNKKLEEHFQEFYNAEVFTAKQAKLIEKDYILKAKVRELIQKLEYFKNDKNISEQRKEDMEAEIIDLKMLLQEGDKNETKM